MELIVVLGAQSGFFDLPQQFLMRLAMLGGSGEPMRVHELLLTGEVHAGKFDQPFKSPAYFFATLATDHGQADVVEGIHQYGVLLIESLYADCARMIPGKKCHKPPSFSRRNS